MPSTVGYTQAKNLTQKFTCGNIELSFGSTGAITHLVDTATNRVWSDSPKNPIGQYQYTTYSANDYDVYLKEYSYCSDPSASNCDWVLKAHGKYNVSEANPQHNDFLPTIQSLWYNAATCDFLVNFIITDSQSYVKYGGARDYWSQFSVSSAAKGNIKIDVTFEWFSKTSTRLPEAHWFTFNPAISPFDPKAWQMDKLGSLVSPLDVVTNGSHNLHGINPLSGIVYSDASSNVLLQSLDIPLVSPGAPSALPAPFVVPDLKLGWNWLLFANIWGTNWPGWYPFVPQDNMAQYRFQLSLSQKN